MYPRPLGSGVPRGGAPGAVMSLVPAGSSSPPPPRSPEIALGSRCDRSNRRVCARGSPEPQEGLMGAPSQSPAGQIRRFRAAPVAAGSRALPPPTPASGYPAQKPPKRPRPRESLDLASEEPQSALSGGALAPARRLYAPPLPWRLGSAPASSSFLCSSFSFASDATGSSAAAASSAAAPSSHGCDLRGQKLSFKLPQWITRCHLNLRKIALEGANVIYKRDVGKVLMKLRKPRITATIWSSGKIICTGATSEEEAKFGARRLARSLQKLGFQVIFTDFKVVNVLAVCNMPFEIRLPEFTKNNRPHASYEPELHPAVCYRIKSLRATLQIFSTGSITVTGPNVKAVATAVEQIYPFVFESRKEIL
ncbi:Hypothetical predicted protein [Marmota monax]|uniref:TATA box-binding protein-like 1 n=1 Tax=Marmota monax TaxID=9995 RepID=A0A5E4CVK7_MARMO|nr:Hypothetical predicted protein [Marmota monax]